MSKPISERTHKKAFPNGVRMTATERNAERKTRNATLKESNRQMEAQRIKDRKSPEARLKRLDDPGFPLAAKKERAKIKAEMESKPSATESKAKKGKKKKS